MSVLLLGGSFIALANDVTVSSQAELETALQGDNTITVKGTITLDRRLSIVGKTITISGGTISGAGKTPIFDIVNSNVTISGVTFKDALNKQVGDEEVKGGAIKMQGGTLIVKESEFVNNKVELTSWEENFWGGGAINAENTVIYIRDTEFTGNVGYHGGALTLNNVTGLVWGCTFDENEATALDATEDKVLGGGAMMVHWDSQRDVEKKLSVFKCKFNGNSAARRGGAIYLYAESGDVPASADDDFSDNNIFTVQGCSFVGNHTMTFDEVDKDCSGGAIGLYMSRPITTNIFTSTFYNNSARNNGGAIDVEDAHADKVLCKLNMVNCTIAGNYITNDGGGNGGGLRMRKYSVNNDGTPAMAFNLVNTIIVANKGKDESNSDFRTQNECLDGIKQIRNCVIRDLNDRNLIQGSNIEVICSWYNNDQDLGDPNANRLFAYMGMWEDSNVIPNDLFDFNNGVFYLRDSYQDNPVMIMAESGDCDADEYAAGYGIYTDQLGWPLNRNYIGAASLLEGEFPDDNVDEDLDVPAGIKEVPVATPAAAKADVWYTLSGMRVADLTKPGLYIHGGKKVVIK